MINIFVRKIRFLYREVGLNTSGLYLFTTELYKRV